jgi:hypothetical protein
MCVNWEARDFTASFLAAMRKLAATITALVHHPRTAMVAMAWRPRPVTSFVRRPARAAGVHQSAHQPARSREPHWTTS